MITKNTLELFVRDSEVPLYSPNGLAITKKGMCNTTRVRDKYNNIHDYIRAIGTDNKSRIMHAVNGRVLFKPVLEPGTDPRIPDEKGVEDGHAITIRNPQTGSLEVLMSYVAYGGSQNGFTRNSIAIAASNDFYNFRKIGVIDSRGMNDKDCVLLERNGSLYLFRRPMDKKTTGWPIVVSELDLKTLTVKDLGEIKPEQPWERLRIGAGFAFGNMLGYHGVDEDGSALIYSAGLMELDEKDPSKVLYRTREPVLMPRTADEINGYKESGQAEPGEKPKKIVILTGYDIYDAPCGRVLRMVYGAGDEYTRTASRDFKTVLRKVRTKRNKVA